MSKKKIHLLVMTLMCTVLMSGALVPLLIISCGLQPSSNLIAPTECIAQHILEGRPDLLARYAGAGWDTSRSNWLNIVTDWSKADPAGYALASENAYPLCSIGELPTEPCSGSFDLNYLPWLAETLSGNSINGEDCGWPNNGYENDGGYNTSKCWYEYCGRSGRWNPLEYKKPDGTFGMPCTTWVSTIWYLAGIKQMDLPPFDGWGWNIISNDAGYAWQTGKHLYRYAETYYPDEMLANPDDLDLYKLDGYQVKTEANGSYYDLASYIDGTVDVVDSRLNVGDILQYYGTPPSSGDSPWKHTVIVVRAAQYYWPAVKISARIASFGYPQTASIEWWKINALPFDHKFDFTKVRVIKRPSYMGKKTPLLFNNLVNNPSFELDLDQWVKPSLGDAGVEIGLRRYDYYDATSAHYGYRFLSLTGAGTYEVRKNVYLYAGLAGPFTYKMKAFVRSGDTSKYYLFVTPGTPGEENSLSDYTNWTLVEKSFSIASTGWYEIGFDVIVPTDKHFDIDDVQVFQQETN